MKCAFHHLVLPHILENKQNWTVDIVLYIVVSVAIPFFSFIFYFLTRLITHAIHADLTRFLSMKLAFASLLLPTVAAWDLAGFNLTSAVQEHSKIDLDLVEINDALISGNKTLAQILYDDGAGNSMKSGNRVRSIGGFWNIGKKTGGAWLHNLTALDFSRCLVFPFSFVVICSLTWH